MDPFLIYKIVANDDSSSSSTDDDVLEYLAQATDHIIGGVPSDPISSRAYINRNREAAQERLVHDSFGPNPLYGEDIFATRFRMRKRLFLKIVNDMGSMYEYFTFRTDARGRQSFTALQKCTSAIRQLAYGIVPDGVDEYLQMSARTSRESLQQFCTGIIDLYRKKYMCKPTVSDVRNLYNLHETKHGFRGMLGSIDCTHWEWRNCPREERGQYMRGVHKHPPMILEVVSSQDMWFWHSFFGVAGSNNDINILRQSPLFNDVINEVAPVCPFEVNGVTYRHGYYLGDGIYQSWSTIVKSFNFPGDEKRKRFKVAQEVARKDVERTFSLLKSKFCMLHNPARPMIKSKMRNIMYVCCILQNMILKDEGDVVCPYYEHEILNQDQVRERNQSILIDVFSRQLPLNLQSDLVEHIQHAFVPCIDGPQQNVE